MMDVQSLLQPVSEGAPGGSNMEYSPEYSALERALKGKPERQIADSVIAAEPPDWGSAIQMSANLLRSSKDLRVAIELTRALLKTESFAGFAQGLALVRGLVESFWPVLHPLLDEGDGDPTARINVMAALTHRDMLQAVRSAALVNSKALGVVTLRDVEAANARPRDGSAGAVPSWDAMFQAMPAADLTAAAQAVDGCEREARELEVAWKMQLESGGHGNTHNGDGRRVDDFTELRQIVAQANRFMKERVEQRSKSEAPVIDGAPGSRPLVAVGASGGELRTRDDVVRALDGICAYYARHEPSSPIPSSSSAASAW